MKRKAGFEDLRIWQESHELMLIVHGIANKLPADENYQKSQMKRSSSSPPDNIAEGYTSYYYNDKLKCFYTARKESGETQNHLRKVADKGYIEKNYADLLISRYEGLIIGINNYNRYIANKRDRKTPRKP